jgi:predicted nucleic acid-binding Zn ribbon protein
MPEYVYRREDGSMFTIRQKFSENALAVDPETGQHVVRVVQPTGIIFKGSGFYVNDSKKASKRNLNGSSHNGHGDNGHGDKSNDNGHSDSGHQTESAKSDAPKTETKKESTKAGAKSDN